MPRLFNFLTTLLLAAVLSGTSAFAAPAAETGLSVAATVAETVAEAGTSECDGCAGGDERAAICIVTSCTSTCAAAAVLSATADARVPGLIASGEAATAGLLAGSAAPPDPFPPRSFV
jgi:hypothetical protein